MRTPHLDWDGCSNVRDLGGLRTADGRTTRWGAFVRADCVDRLSPAGWSALQAHGVRTIVDLRNDDERDGDVAQRPAGLTTRHLPLDGVEHADFWDYWASGPQFGTPLYYGPHIERFPERSASVLAAIATAPPGGVVVHCVGGRDRTGQIAMLLLALAGVAPDEIAADYALSAGRTRNARPGGEDDGAEIERFLEQSGTSTRELIVSTLAELDVERELRRGGLDDADLAALRARLLEPA